MLHNPITYYTVQQVHTVTHVSYNDHSSCCIHTHIAITIYHVNIYRAGEREGGREGGRGLGNISATINMLRLPR